MSPSVFLPHYSSEHKLLNRIVASTGDPSETAQAGRATMLNSSTKAKYKKKNKITNYVNGANHALVRA
ncbi:MAG: hypothetical protein JWQ09_3573 [Segetibacter sp.]|nr:hypothetical protein [Segetibacter sp.]